VSTKDNQNPAPWGGSIKKFTLVVEIEKESKEEAFLVAINMALDCQVNVSVKNQEEDLGVFTYDNKYYVSSKAAFENGCIKIKNS
jgi:hypothetical protein